MGSSQQAHELFLLMVQLSQMRDVERIWDFFVDGFNHIGIGVTLRRASSVEPDAYVLPVIASGKEFGSLVLTEAEPEALPLTRNAVAMLAVVLQGRFAVLELAELQATTQDALKDAQLFNERILDTTPDLIYIYDLDVHSNVYVNRSVESLLGLHSKEVQGLGPRLFDALIHPDDLAAVLANQEHLIQVRDGEVTEVEYRMRDQKGQWRWFHSRETPFARHADGSLWRKLGLAVDVTEQKLIEEHLRQSQKMEAIGRLAGGVAHDFNNILCAINGNAEMVLEELSERDPLRESLLEIHEAAARATQLTRQLLAFSRKQLIAPKRLELSKQIELMQSMLNRLLGEDILLSTHPHPSTRRILVDPNQIEQLILNLAINARDAMPRGGELVIETSEFTNEQGGGIQNLAPGQWVVLKVTDTGLGMSPEVVSRVFEPFFTTKELGQGTGLGLATVFGIVEQNDAHIEVHSVVGEGTTFTVYFPAIDSDSSELEVVAAPPPESGEGTILVVEDEESVRRVASRLLRRLGYSPIVASSGGDALVLAERHEGTIDVLLTDVVMPHMNGRELAERLTAERPGLKVLFTSGYSENVIAQHGVLDETVHFLSKPYTMNSLATRLREVLKSKTDGR